MFHGQDRIITNSKFLSSLSLFPTQWQATTAAFLERRLPFLERRYAFLERCL